MKSISVGGKSWLYGVITLALLSGEAAYAVTVTTVGSFNDPAASSTYFYNRTYNQDDATTPARQLPSNLQSTTDSVAYFGWGIDAEARYATRKILQSHFWFNGTGSVDGGLAASPTLGTAFSMGSFTYTNQRTILSGGVVNIDLQMNIDIDGLSLMPVEYRFEIDNTKNSLPDPSDTARITAMPGDISFLLDGTQYLLTFNGFSRDGGLTFETAANLAEGQQTTAQIYGTLTAVPLPAAIWLMATGLLALTGFVRTKK